jgi:hypothetical protein
MKEVQTRELNRIIILLAGMGCKYAIQDPDGKTHTNGLEVVEAKSGKRGPRKYPHNYLKDYVAKHFDYNVAVGVVQEVPIGDVDRESLRSSLCSRLCREWGNETYTSHMTATHLEVMRTA